jgi:uncharacterized membrane protein YhaH (DUF805 family)
MAEVTTPVETTPEMTIGKIWLSFEGRISRSTWWMKYILPYIGISIAMTIADAIFGTNIVIDEYSGQTMGILTMIWGLANIWFGLAAGAKRCHDRNRSGWFQAIALIPILGGLWLLIELGFLRGTVGPNRFGPDPVAE